MNLVNYFLEKVGFFSHKKEPWQIVAARFCVDTGGNGVNLENLQSHLRAKGYIVKNEFIIRFFSEEVEMPPGRDYTTARRGVGGMWEAPLELVSKITDFEELKVARKNASRAFWLAIIAIIVSVLAAVYQIRSVQDVSVVSVSDKIISEIEK